MIKKSLAFTLGEILIALTVIGVVAVLVMPQVLVGQKAAKAKAQFDTAYSLLSKAIADMDADDVSIDPKDYKVAGSFYPKFKEYNKITIDCGVYAATNDSVCFSTTNAAAEQTYSNHAKGFHKMNTLILDDGGFVLNNGMLVIVENPQNHPYGLLITVDLNGKKKLPNKWGYDVFTFEVVDGDLYPVGAPGTGQDTTAKTLWGKDAASVKKYCSNDNTDSLNGMTCSFFAATNENYFYEVFSGH